MLPGSYSFAMTYNGTREQQNHVTVTGASSTGDVFKTTDVTVQLEDPSGASGSSAVAGASYYASGWHAIGDRRCRAGARADAAW